MSIGVQSYPELYTLLLGWDLYDKIWQLLTQTGIAYLPFVGIILKNFTRAYLSHRDAGPFALRNMEINLIVTLFLILLAVSPCIPVSAHSISYTPICGAQKDKTYFPGDTGTTYDKAFSVPKDNIYIPIWWYAVISISEGMTNAANTFVGCVPDLRKMVTEVSMTQISDSELKQEVLDFENMCFIPARMQFNQDKQNNIAVHLDRIQNNVKEQGVEDSEWLGSHGFNEVYYRNLKATQPIPGFPYEASQDINADINQAHQPPFTSPTCYEWWNQSEHGLKHRLYQALPKSFSGEYKDYVSDAKSQDDVIKQILRNASDGFNGVNYTSNEAGYSNVVSAIGILFQQMEEYPKLYAAGQAAPIIQALLLLMIYVFLPFALVFSSYRPGTFVTGAIIIFSVIFWGLIWHLVSWADTALMQALYSNWFAKQGPSATLADMIIGSLIIFSPLFWFMFMGAMGVAIGDVVSNFAMGMNKMGERAAMKGTAVAKMVGQAVGTALL